MKYGFTFLLLAFALFELARQHANLSWLLGWLGLNFLFLGGSYWRKSAALFGKQEEGNLFWGSVLFWLPFLCLKWFIWHLQIRLTSEDVCNEIKPGLWLGRRVFAKELPASIEIILDLTEGFPKPKNYPAKIKYYCLPTLDAYFPSQKKLEAMLSSFVSEKKEIYIHCAQGHGRSTLCVALLLVLRNEAKELSAALNYIKGKRPAVHLNRSQFEFGKKFLADFQKNKENEHHSS